MMSAPQPIFAIRLVSEWDWEFSAVVSTFCESSTRGGRSFLQHKVLRKMLRDSILVSFRRATNVSSQKDQE